MSLHFFSHGSNYVFVFFFKNTRNLVQLFQDAYQLPFTSKLKAIKSGVLRESGDYLRWSAECYMFHEYVFLQDSCRCLTAPLQGMASNMPFPSSLGFACCVPHVFEPFNFWKSEGRGGLHYKSPALAAWSLGHWTTREVLVHVLLISFSCFIPIWCWVGVVRADILPFLLIMVVKRLVDHWTFRAVLAVEFL